MLGKWLVHVPAADVPRAGKIVETEAYVGPDDLASHARIGARGRAAIMFGPPGMAYVYLVYGMHHCFNAVTETEGYPGAVLVRAIEPVAPGQRGNGPALVCRALGIDRSCNGVDLTGASLHLADGPPEADADVRMGPRIGVEYAGQWAAHPWRFWVANSAHLSRRRLSGSVFDPAMLG